MKHLLKRIKKNKLFLIVILVIFSNLKVNAQVIRGRLLYSGSKSIKKIAAPNLQVILVPRTTSNEKTLDNLFFYCDNTEQLKSMNAKITLTDNAVFYNFNKIPKGKYILKVCDAYGILYKFTIVDNVYKTMFIPDKLATYNLK
jgi:hypothetical protein